MISLVALRLTFGALYRLFYKKMNNIQNSNSKPSAENGTKPIVSCRLSKSEEDFYYTVLNCYNGITSQIAVAGEMGLTRQVVQRLARQLEKKKIMRVSICPGNLDGNIYSLIAQWENGS